MRFAISVSFVEIEEIAFIIANSFESPTPISVLFIELNISPVRIFPI